MGKITVPELFDELSSEQLTELRDKIVERGSELSASETLSTEIVDELEQLAADLDRVDSEIAGRAVEAERVEGLRSRFTAAAVVEETVENETEVVEQLGDAGDSGADEPVVETPAGDATPETPVVDGRPQGAELAAKLNSLNMQPAAGSPASNGAMFAGLTATHKAPRVAEGSELSNETLAEVIVNARRGINSLGEGRNALATATMPFDETRRLVVNDHEKNFGLLRQATEEAKTLVASGGSCAPSAPVYDIFRTAKPKSPVEANLPVVNAPRGAIRWIQAPSYADAADGVGVYPGNTEFGDGSGEVLKACVQADCPDSIELYVTAVTQCVLWDNLNYQVFPEQVQAFLEDLAFWHASKKERLYLDRIDATSTSVTGSVGYGATRSLLRNILTAAAGYRLRNGMNIDDPLDWYVPVWATEMLKADMIADLSLGQNFRGVDTATVLSELRTLTNLNTVLTYDSATSEPEQTFRDEQTSGALNVFPGEVVSYLHAPGTYFRLDGGTLDVGIVRDSALNATNDLQLFSEQWVEAGMAGTESLKLTVEVCPDGTGPEGVDPYICSGS